jgi:hypothetical protein
MRWNCGQNRASRSADIFRKSSRCCVIRRSKEFVVDGEIVIEVDGSLSFDALQMRLHPGGKQDPESCRSQTPAKLILFDMLAIPDASLMHQPLSARRATLELFVKSAGHADIELSRCTMIWRRQAGLANPVRVRRTALLPSLSMMNIGPASAPWSKSSACARRLRHRWISVSGELARGRLPFARALQ